MNTPDAFTIADRWHEIVVAEPGWAGVNFTSEDRNRWLTDSTYINGCVAYIDRDYEVAYLLEVGDQHPSGTRISYLALILKPSGREVSWYEQPIKWDEHSEASVFDVIRWFHSIAEDALLDRAAS